MEPMASRIFSGSDPVSKSGSHQAALWSIFSILDQLKSTYCLQKLIHLLLAIPVTLSFCLYNRMKQSTSLNSILCKCKPNLHWGKREWVPPSVATGWTVCLFFLYNMSYLSHFWLLFCEFLRRSTQQEDTRGPTYSMARVIRATSWQKGFICEFLRRSTQQEDTHGPTYSMARVIRATSWQKGFICWWYYLHCH